MPRTNADRQRFRNDELLLEVSSAVDRNRWDENRYEAYIDELCEDREYQKEAIRVALRYLLGGEYANLRALARRNYDENPVLERKHGSWSGMERHLQLPDQLSASLDLATGTGKSYVLYGIAAILLAEGAVDRVLVLCPSTTIETGLLDKFRELASDTNLRDLLPAGARIAAPHIISASETITSGSICVENYHAILEHVGSSIRDSLRGKGRRTAVLNDEAHHVVNESAAKTKRWKEFLLNPDYGFHYVLGVTGTPYVGDEYFSDVIYRYSLRQAMEDRFVKRVEYVAEMPQTREPEEKWQLIRGWHEETKRKLKRRDLLPLTIVVTARINRCKEVAEELKAFLIESERISRATANERVLVIYNNAPDVATLKYVDSPASKVEWIVSVSMLNEGWDVKRVFQIVPHEERAFDSKLLIAQVLGRGLRIPNNWEGPQPEVTVFNHDAWAPRIRHLVNEILEIERRLTCHVIDDSEYHFDLHNIDYTLVASSVKKPMSGAYNLFEKGYIEVPAEVAAENVSVEFERAMTGDRYKWQTTIQHKTYTPREIAVRLYDSLLLHDMEDPDPAMRTYYTDRYPVTKLEAIVKESLARRGMEVATEQIKQKFLQAIGPLGRKTSENVRYVLRPDCFKELSTRHRQADSVSAAELRRDKVLFYTEQTRATLKEEQLEFFDEVAESGGPFRSVRVMNRYDFKSATNAVIADSDPERRFINHLSESENAAHLSGWIKSTHIRFYEIDYAWKKGNTPKRGKFSPDFFIKHEDYVLCIEIKGDEELKEPSEENRKKHEYASAHFVRVNEHLESLGVKLRYKLNFLTPSCFGAYFQYIRQGNIREYESPLDIKLREDL